MKLPHVLSRTKEVKIDLDRYRADELKKAAGFWVGKEAAQFRKEACIQALIDVFNAKTSDKKVALPLADKQRQVLRIFARYGPVVSGPLLAVELQQRGLHEKKDELPRSYYANRHNRVVSELRNKLILLSDGYYHSYYDRRFPELTLHPAIAKAIEPAEPMPWQPSQPSPDAASTYVRSSAEPALDLWRVAEALGEMGNWKTVKGDALSKGSRNKLRKLAPLPSADTNELDPPDAESLFYELLRALGFLSMTLEPRRVDVAALERHFDQPPAVQAWHWMRAWLETYLWQDGVGVVPDRDGQYDPARISPYALHEAKELLLWALCRVAHSDLDWLDLELFLTDFWHATQDATSGFYWYGYSWDPDFEMAQRKNEFPRGPERSLAFWLDGAGVWTANAVMVTLATLGFIERGESGGAAKRPCFRLTPLGRQVLGAPEVQAMDERTAEPFLTVQPNYEIVAYLEAADARATCKLARFARRTSAASGPVQTFSIGRATTYAALQAGMTAAEIEAFLVEHGKTELPANVRRSLQEWSGKRESLVLRTGVVIALAADGVNLGKLGSEARALSDTCSVLPASAAEKAVQHCSRWTVLDHRAPPARAWRVDELGSLHVGSDDLLSRQRLTCFAERSNDGWLISEKSIARARGRGFTADQILQWLAERLTHETPALLSTAIRNWSGRTTVFAGKLHLIQITRPDAREAILRSTAFQPLIAGHVPPDWFIVHNDQAKAAERLLKHFGFRIDSSYRVAASE